MATLEHKVVIGDYTVLATTSMKRVKVVVYAPMKHLNKAVVIGLGEARKVPAYTGEVKLCCDDYKDGAHVAAGATSYFMYFKTLTSRHLTIPRLAKEVGKDLSKLAITVTELDE